MNDEITQAPSMIRAIIQPNYLDTIFKISVDNQHFHSCSITLFQQFIDKLKVNQISILGKKNTHTHTSF